MITNTLISFGLSILGALFFLFSGFMSGMVAVCTCAPEDIGKYHHKWRNRRNWKFYLEAFILCFIGFTLFHFAHKF